MSESVVLVSSDGTAFTVPKEQAECSGVLKGMLVDVDDVGDNIPVMVEQRALSNVVAYMTGTFTMPTEREELLELVVAANYLNIESLLDEACGAVADLIKDKQPEQIREIFGLENTFTPEEEAAVRRENAWAFR